MKTNKTQTRIPTLQRLMANVSPSASYGHTGETRSESDVGVSTQRLIVDSARSNGKSRMGRNDEDAFSFALAGFSGSRTKNAAVQIATSAVVPFLSEISVKTVFQVLLLSTHACVSAASVQTDIPVTASC